MPTQIKKRDGRIVPFNPQTIANAILKAGNATHEFGNEIAMHLANEAIEHIESDIREAPPTVEMIQDIVENVLLSSPFKATAKAYILYRDQHAKMRQLANVINNGLVDHYLQQADWRVKENSNMAYSLQGLNNFLASEINKEYWLNKIYPEHIRRAHEEGAIHIHDLNILSVYCVGWDLYDLLLNGFTGVEGKIASAPPKHFRAALGQIVNFFYTLQGEAAGAQAFSNFDTLLAPFIRYDGLEYHDIKQAIQEFLFNINVPTRVGFQTPFTNITLDLNVPSHYADQAVIIGGKPQQETYADFQHEMDLLNRAFWEVMEQGDANGRVFTFPIPTVNITKDFDWDNPEHEGLWKATGKYGLPYFSNFVNSDLNPEDARSMCCRLRIDNRKLEKRGGGLFGANPLTGSIGVVTINLPRLALQSTNEDSFFQSLEQLMETARDSLEIKRKLLERLTDNSLYPYTKFYLRSIKERFGCYWENHFSTIGIIGMNEALQTLIGANIASTHGRALAKRTLNRMRDILERFQEETGHHYNLEATPAEGTSYRLAQLDKKRFHDACFANGSGKHVETPYYTNSTHLPVNYTSDPFEALELQDELQTKYTGGTVLHLFLGERISEPESVKRFVKTICERYHIPYITLSPTFSVCPSHGYIPGEMETCESCGKRCEIYSRIVGYLRPVNQWNDAKRHEFGIRSTFKVKDRV